MLKLKQKQRQYKLPQFRLTLFDSLEYFSLWTIFFFFLNLKVSFQNNRLFSPASELRETLPKSVPLDFGLEKSFAL